MIALIDSGGANIRSIHMALDRIGAEVELTLDPRKIQQADALILPGVGTAAVCREKLIENGLFSALTSVTAPVLGICIGMHLLGEELVEGDCQGLGLIPCRVDRLSSSPGFPVPHMGWNQIKVKAEDPLLRGLDDAWFYFTHSYCLPLVPETIAETEYQQVFSAVVKKDNWYGVQFHPERSAESGLHLLKNFVEMNS